MGKGLAIGLAVLAAGLGGCSSTPVVRTNPRADVATRHAGSARAGEFEVRWSTMPEVLRAMRSFDLLLCVHREAGDCRSTPQGAQVFVSAWNADLESGLRGSAEAFRAKDGRWLAEDLCFPVGGRWSLAIDVVHGGLAQRAEFELVIP